MSSKGIPSRQVHLDFHTSEAVPNVGAEFNEKQFIDCLKAGHLNSITVFASCHHGWCYYDTKVGKAHPTMKKELLPQILKACEKAGVAAPIYITVGWNVLQATLHPDWIKVDKKGEKMMPKSENPDAPRPEGSWPNLCLNSPYLDYQLALTKEVMEKFMPVGIFYDIMQEGPCYCEYCKKAMKERGIDINNDAEVNKYATEVYINYLKKCFDLIQQIKPGTRVFYNSVLIKGREELYPYYTHYEIESLPTGGWGYDHFPQAAKYINKKGFDFLGMTGKFHKSWGEFGGFKNPDALKYECAFMNSMGAKCSIGDQLHPSGKMDTETYRIIGEAYAYVEKTEKYWMDAESAADIAVLCPTAVRKNGNYENVDFAVSATLLEMHYQFDMIDEKMDFSKYKLLILPGDIAIENDELKDKLNKFIKDGGAMILSRFSGMDAARKKFLLNAGVELKSDCIFDKDYMLVGKKISKNLVSTPFINYHAGLVVKPLKGTEVLAEAVPPYFKRTYAHFCSHANTPYDMEAERYPAATKSGKVIYFPHRIFQMYKTSGMKLHRDMISNCIDLIYKPIVKTNLPSCGRVILMKKKNSDDMILNLFYVTPVKRGSVEVIEDVVPLYDVEVEIDTDKEIKSLKAVNAGKKLDFKQNGRTVKFTLPKLMMHEIIVIK